MKIGDTVFVHGFVDEIRKDAVIIRNEGGYFGTVPAEIFYPETIVALQKLQEKYMEGYREASEDLAQLRELLSKILKG